MSKDKVVLEFLPWKKARKYISAVNPELTEIIDGWDPNEDFGFYKAAYRYGDLLLDEGELCLPLENGELVLLSDGRVPAKIKEDLSYSSFPISIPIQKATEVFIELNRRIIPFALFPTGTPLGLLETLDPVDSYCIRNIWNISVGARSAFMLPKISDRLAHEKLVKEFKISATKPNVASDHFNVFKELSRSENFPDKSWSCDILIMNKMWFQSDYKNYHWLRFNNYLHEFMVRYSSFARNKNDVMYQLFVKELEERNKKTFAHLFDTLKHIVAIMVGVAPGFRPVYEDDHIGPFAAIQKIYVDTYLLSYCPTIMTLHHYDVRVDKRPVYYSISQPSLFESFPRSRKLESYIDDLYQLKLLLDTFFMVAKKERLRIEGTHIETAIRNTAIEYFHTIEEGRYSGIQQTKIMSERDPFFSKVKLHSRVKEMKFSEISSFTRSCISFHSFFD